jgi:hypothetical protein
MRRRNLIHSWCRWRSWHRPKTSPVGRIQRGKQCGRAVAFVVVRHGDAASALQRQARLSTVQSLNLALSSAHSTSACSGGLRSQVPYSYDDATQKTFADYRLISDVAKISRSSYDYVIVTLDGFTERKPEATALLKSIGEAIQESSTDVIIGGIGVGLHDYYLRTMALNGALGMMCHQVANFKIPLHAPTDPVLLSKAEVAYRQTHKSSFLLDDRFPKAAQRITAIYDVSGVSSCQIMRRHEFAMMTKFPVCGQRAARVAACEGFGQQQRIVGVDGSIGARNPGLRGA